MLSNSLHACCIAIYKKGVPNLIEISGTQTDDQLSHLYHENRSVTPLYAVIQTNHQMKNVLNRLRSESEEEQREAAIDIATGKISKDLAERVMPLLTELLRAGKSERQGAAVCALISIARKYPETVPDIEPDLIPLLRDDTIYQQHYYNATSAIRALAVLKAEARLDSIERAVSWYREENEHRAWAASTLTVHYLKQNSTGIIDYEHINYVCAQGVTLLARNYLRDSPDDYTVAAILLDDILTKNAQDELRDVLLLGGQNQPEQLEDAVPYLAQNIRDRQHRSAGYALQILRKYVEVNPEELTHLIDYVAAYLDPVQGYKDQINSTGFLAEVVSVAPDQVAVYRKQIEEIQNHNEEDIQRHCSTILETLDEVDNALSVENPNSERPIDGAEGGESPFYSGEITDSKVQRVEHDDGDATVIVEVDGEEYTVRETQEDGANIVVEDGTTTVMHQVTELDVGDTVTVRYLYSSYVTLHGYQSDIAVNDVHSAIKEETHVQVYEYTDDGHAYGIGTEGELKGNVVFLGSLTCPRNTHVAVTPMDDSVRGDKVAVCTDPKFWSDAYLNELAHVTDLSLDQLEVVRLDIGAETRNVTSTQLENDSTSTSSDNMADSESAHASYSESNDTTTDASHSDESKHSSPDLTEDDESFITARRRERDQAFAQKVKDAYDERCAMCGTRRVAPNGSIEVEAAHIYPKSEGGVDDVRNGLALCKLHHWAFDNGWLSVTDDYDIIVRGAENRDGYDEFRDLDGDVLHLPNDEDMRPHPQFLHGHRSLHGFEE